MPHWPRPGTLRIERETLSDHDFTSIRCERLVVIDSQLSRCDFREAKLGGASFGSGNRGSAYTECRFDGAIIDSRAAGRARFVACSFRDTEIREFFGMKTEFVDCVFSGEIRRAVFCGTPPTGPTEQPEPPNEFAGNDFSRARLIDVAFRCGIDLAIQRLPSGRDYVYVSNAVRSVGALRRAVQSWEHATLRKSGLALVENMAFNVRGGQQQLFLSRGAVPPAMSEAADLIFELLREIERA